MESQSVNQNEQKIKDKILRKEIARQKKKEYHKEYNLRHREKILERKRLRQKLNKDKNRQYLLRKKYNITLDDYNKILLEQDGKCWTCSVKAEDTRFKVLSVDHNHLTGEIRGLLCDPCNTAIGLLRESQEIIEKVSRYLHEKGSCAPKEVG